MAVRLPNGQIAIHKFQTQEGLWDFFKPDEPKPHCVILEEWQYFDGIARPEGVHTAGLVASIKGICYVLGIPLSLRTPSRRMPSITAAKDHLKSHRPGWKDTKQNSHEVDALAHLLVWEHENARFLT